MFNFTDNTVTPACSLSSAQTEAFTEILTSSSESTVDQSSTESAETSTYFTVATASDKPNTAVPAGTGLAGSTTQIRLKYTPIDREMNGEHFIPAHQLTLSDDFSRYSTSKLRVNKSPAN